MLFKKKTSFKYIKTLIVHFKNDNMDLIDDLALLKLTC